MEHFKSKVVSYFYDDEIGNFCYGGGNPMRPHRVRLTHDLVENYGLVEKLKVFRPTPQDQDEIAMFHADEYVDFLNTVTPDNQEEYLTQLRRFNLGPAGEADCPVFDGLFEYCQIYSGGSVNGAGVLAAGDADICLNWSGGMHHAKKAEASGFCYINDIVLGILELLKTHQRVLYVDIDIHHGDGVEEAFYLTDRVMTVSFHKYGDFFPGTGAVGDIGYGPGKYYSLNVPLQEGMDDESYRMMFEPIMQKVMEKFQPGAVVVCGGADSLSGDRLGCFNLSLEGHSNCIEFLGRFNVPMLVLGGGGYTMRNVARCWAYETGRLQGVDLPDKLPQGALASYDYYMDTHNLRIATSNMKNGNSREMMEKIKEECLRNLHELPAAPGAQFHTPPPMHKVPDAPEEDADQRGGGKQVIERRVNKFEGNLDDEVVEENANSHRGGRDFIQSARSADPVARADQQVTQVKKDSSVKISVHADDPKADHAKFREPEHATFGSKDVENTKGTTCAAPATTQTTSERFASSSGVRTTAGRASGSTMPDSAEHNPPSAHPSNVIPPAQDEHLDCLQQGKPSAVLGYTETGRADNLCANASKTPSMQQVVPVGHGREQATPSTDTSSQALRGAEIGNASERTTGKDKITDSCKAEESHCAAQQTVAPCRGSTTAQQGKDAELLESQAQGQHAGQPTTEKIVPVQATPAGHMAVDSHGTSAKDVDMPAVDGASLLPAEPAYEDILVADKDETEKNRQMAEEL